jgi:hypothetical protein
MRYCYLAAVLLFASTAYAQPEESTVECVGRLECADEFGTIVLPEQSMTSEDGCIRCQTDLEHYLRTTLPSPTPCPGYDIVFRLMKCGPYTDLYKQSTSATTDFTVLLDYKFTDGHRRGPVGTGGTLELARADAMTKLWVMIDSGAYGAVCRGTGRCFSIAPGSDVRTPCSAPECPIRQACLTNLHKVCPSPCLAVSSVCPCRQRPSCRTVRRFR